MTMYDSHPSFTAFVMAFCRVLCSVCLCFLLAPSRCVGGGYNLFVVFFVEELGRGGNRIARSLGARWAKGCWERVRDFSE